MNSIIEAIEGAHRRLTTLDFDIFELSEIFVVLGFSRPFPRFYERVWDGETEIGLITYISDLWGISKSDVRRLIKGGGLKINNSSVPENITLKDLPWLKIDDWKVCVIKKGKNEFDFILW